MEQQGWIKLHRKILENPISKKPTYAWLWVYLLLKANHKEERFIWNNTETTIKEGQLLTGRKNLSLETGIPETTIERALEYFEKNGHQIRQQKTTKFRIITILNWSIYQQENIKTDNKRTTNGQQTDTNKNDKNEENDKKRESVPLSTLFEQKIKIPETHINYQLLITEKEKFLDYWTAKNNNGKKEYWQMQRVFDVEKRWRTWLRNAEKYMKPKEYKKPVDNAPRGGGFSKV